MKFEISNRDLDVFQKSLVRLTIDARYPEVLKILELVMEYRAEHGGELV